MRNIRLEFDRYEFSNVSLGFFTAYLRWRLSGRKHKTVGVNNFLYQSKINAVPSLHNTYTTNDEMRVEIQKWADMIHLHFRNLRLEFTIDEFREYAAAISAADRKLEGNPSDYSPIREGAFHVACPKGRVIGESNGFWTTEDHQKEVDDPYTTQYLDDADNMEMQPKRHDGDNDLFDFNIDDLYYLTLWHPSSRKAFGTNHSGLFIPLQNRYQFAQLVLAGKIRNDDDIRETEYFKLLSTPIKERPRDGAPDSVYTDPLVQARWYVDMINLLKDHGYPLKFESVVLAEQKDEKKPRFTDAKGQGIVDSYEMASHITISISESSVEVINGLHRLAALKALTEMGIIANRRITCRAIRNDISSKSLRNVLRMGKSFVPNRVYRRIPRGIVHALKRV